LSSGQFLNELVKFKNLIEHYQEHQQNSSFLDFAEFIQLHYFDPKHEGTDPQNHNSLPLHQSSICMNFVFQSPVDILTIFYPDFSSSISHYTEYAEFLPKYNSSAIFQPPKVIA
jgi:hypothetical protein